MIVDLFSFVFLTIVAYIFISLIVDELGIMTFIGILMCFINSKIPWIIKYILISEMLKCEKVYLIIKKTWYLLTGNIHFVLILFAFNYVLSNTDITVPAFFIVALPDTNFLFKLLVSFYFRVNDYSQLYTYCFYESCHPP